ncbi:peroxidase 7 [Aristolochia californica]|uniref:peroxidase 7 n=1 Tax=Aristolochia californica TaxID=171875 RepID=UPI0035DD1CC0
MRSSSLSFLLVSLFLSLQLFAQAIDPLGPVKKLTKKLPLQDNLSSDYYATSCPSFESIVHNKLNSWYKKDYTIAAAILRLHFHDCAIRGCDASILLNYPGSERKSKASESLRGFELIDEIKAEVESKCPRTVSCSDILTTAARDATLMIGGPFWEVPFGRKDGKVSLSKDADTVPMGHENVTSLIEFFQARGMNQLDLVVLSGSHTLGRSTCGSIQDRLYNYKRTGKPDSNLNSLYLNYLKRKCRWANEYVNLDASTPRKFDSMYYKNLEKKMGLLSTDQLLYSDSRTKPLVTALANQPLWLFHQQFAVSMVKLGNTQVLLGSEGEVREHCSYRNA